MLKLIISPAKKMNVCNDSFLPQTEPVFLAQSQKLLEYLRTRSAAQLKELWRCNDRILQLNMARLSSADLHRNLSPALLSYEGLQYQAMAPAVFDRAQWDYVKTHLFILSGFYGILRPFDGVIPYRLEMQARLATPFCRDLYDFWGDSILRQLTASAKPAGSYPPTAHTEEPPCVIVDLASKEYSKAVRLRPAAGASNAAEAACFLTCIFESEAADGSRKVKATEAKMARGGMVRYLASCAADSPEALKQFSERGFCFDPRRSCAEEFRFVKPYRPRVGTAGSAARP